MRLFKFSTEFSIMNTVIIEKNVENYKKIDYVVY